MKQPAMKLDHDDPNNAHHKRGDHSRNSSNFFLKSCLKRAGRFLKNLNVCFAEPIPFEDYFIEDDEDYPPGVFDGDIKRIAKMKKEDETEEEIDRLRKVTNDTKIRLAGIPANNVELLRYVFLTESPTAHNPGIDLGFVLTATSLESNLYTERRCPNCILNRETELGPF